MSKNKSGSSFGPIFHLEPRRCAIPCQHILNVSPDDHGEPLDKVVWQGRSVFILAIPLRINAQRCSHLSCRPAAFLAQPVRPCDQPFIEQRFFVPRHARVMPIARPKVV